MDESTGFNHVGGLQDHIQSLKEIVLFPLIYKDLYDNLKIKPPKGVLFYGPPGTGKTLVAAALANECSRANKKVSFFNHKGAECLTKWVGESEKHLRTLFEKALQLSPSIIFFDEIDGLAPIRSSQHDQVHSSVVSTLLALMDGLNTKGHIVVIGATNRIDAIDPALRRPGRFDRELYFPLPSRKARYEILMVHSGRLSEQISLPYMRHLAATTEGYCGSDIQALCSEALMCSVRRQFPHIYAAEVPLDLSGSDLRVERQDFQNAKTKIVPAALRVSYTPSKRLSSKIKPLFGHTLCRAMDALRKTSLAPFIQERKGLRRTMMDVNTPNLPKTFEKSSDVKHHGNICPHFLLVGSLNQGQTDHLAPAMLHCLEDLPVTILNITSLFETSGRTPEEACIHKMKEARQSLPGVLYMPDISGWWNLVDEAATAVFLTMVRELDAGDLPVLLLATAHIPYESLPTEIQNLFTEYHGQVFTMGDPSDKERRDFFSRIFIKRALKPPSVGDMSSNCQEQVLLCKVPTVTSTPSEESHKKSKSRKRKSKEGNTSTGGHLTDNCKGTTSTGQRLPDGTSGIPAKKQIIEQNKEKKRDCIHFTDDEDDEFKECIASKHSTSGAMLISAAKQRRKLSSRATKQQPKSLEILQQLSSVGKSGHVPDIQVQRGLSKDDEFPYKCDYAEDLVSSSSTTSIGDDEITSMDKSSNSNTCASDLIKIDKAKLEKLLTHATNLTNGCPFHTILMLHSRLLDCVSKYKNVLDRTQLPQELEENLEKFQESELYLRKS